MQYVRIYFNDRGCTPQILTKRFRNVNFATYRLRYIFGCIDLVCRVVGIVNSDANQNVCSKYVRESSQVTNSHAILERSGARRHVDVFIFVKLNDLMLEMETIDNI